MNGKIQMRNGDTMLIMVKDGAVIHFTPNMSLPQPKRSWWRRLFGG
jgi:hypothetical protein